MPSDSRVPVEPEGSLPNDSSAEAIADDTKEDPSGDPWVEAGMALDGAFAETSRSSLLTTGTFGDCLRLFLRLFVHSPDRADRRKLACSKGPVRKSSAVPLSD